MPETISEERLRELESGTESVLQGVKEYGYLVGYGKSGSVRMSLDELRALIAAYREREKFDLHSKVPPTTQAGFETLLYMENRHCALTTALNMAGFTRDELLELSRLAYLGSDVAITPELSGDVLEKLDAMLAEEGE